jgi:hypothetical protein
MPILSSETLQKEVFGKQPNYYDLDFTQKLEKMLSQYSVSPEASQAIENSRIPSLLSESIHLSDGTAQRLAGLRGELIVAQGLGNYASACAKLEEANKGRISDILMGKAANDDRFTAAA